MRTLAEVNAAAEHYYFSAQQTGIDNRCRERMIKRCLPHVKPGAHTLELGFMDGQWTDHFLQRGCTVVAVEGSERNVQYGRGKYKTTPQVTMIHSLFDDFNPREQFDLIHMGGNP